MATEVRQVVRQLVAGEKPWPLVMMGSPGSGKTCTALCLLDYVGGEYYTVWSLCDLLVQSQQGRLEIESNGEIRRTYPAQFWGRVARSPLVVLDELGCRDRASDHHFECVKNLIDARHGKPLVVVSNHQLDDLARLYDDRIASRLAAGTVVEVGGKDRRLN